MKITPVVLHLLVRIVEPFSKVLSKSYSKNEDKNLLAV